VWFPGVDAALVGLVLVFAFATASFVARNSDLFLHLAAGKRLLAGQYTPGSDPFSYSAADRPWVNHSWLLDAVAYLLYGGSGIVLVVVKAITVTVAFGLLIAIRRPPFALWPWAGVACVAVLASAPQFTLRPTVVSILFLSVTMYLLFRVPHKSLSGGEPPVGSPRPTPWQFPGAIGITFWLWANCDEWFFIGPLALALLVLGDLIQAKVLKVPNEQPAAENDPEPLGRLPDTATLAKALGIGVLACMLNPHHVRVWQLPFELVGATGASVDPRFRELLYAPTDSSYFSNPELGYNLNGLAYVVLFLGGALALGFGPGRIRVAHIALWIGFAILSLFFSATAIPFLAVVAVPLIASQLNAVGARVELKSWGDPRSRLLWLGSSAGRIVSVLVVCLLCVIAYPGWAQPDPNTPPYARRVAWGVEPEPATVQAAEQFKAWRASGRLPTDARGFVTGIDLANYLAWFAPEEKVFINGRLAHHTRELPDFITVRRALGLFEVKDETSRTADANPVLKKAGAEFIALHAGSLEPLELQRRVITTVNGLYREPAEWSPWYLDGRTTVFGWRPPGEPAGPRFARLRVDPVVLAFGPGVEPAPDPADLPMPLVPLGWEEPFVRPPRPAPIGAAQARAWLRFRPAPRDRQILRELVYGEIAPKAFFAVPTLTGRYSAHNLLVEVAARTGSLRFPSAEETDPMARIDAADLRALPFLTVRAARRAIFEAPDHPDAYYALALAMDDPLLPLSESDRTLTKVTALRQCLERLPKPDRYRRGQFATPASQVAFLLAATYAGRPIFRRDPESQRLVRDPKTGQEIITGFYGLPVNVPPIGQMIGQAVLEDKEGNSQRVPYSPNMPPNVPLFFLPLDAAYDAAGLALRYLPADTVGETADETKRRTEQYELLRKHLQDAMVRANELLGQQRVGIADLPRLVIATLASGRADEALKILSEADLEKEFKGEAPLAAARRVSLELALGRLEEANASLAILAKPESVAALEKAKLTELVQLLRYQKTIYAGEYKAAGELWNAIAGRGVGEAAKMPPLGPTVPKSMILQAIAALWRKPTEQEAEKVLAGLLAEVRPLTALPRSLTTELWLPEWHAIAGLMRAGIAEQMQREANYFTRRGILSLFEGDIPAAKRWFQQARREPPPGWGLPAEFPGTALLHLRLIEMAEKRAAAP
jgi:hypothetical protein